MTQQESSIRGNKVRVRQSALNALAVQLPIEMSSDAGDDAVDDSGAANNDSVSSALMNSEVKMG